MSTPVKVGWLTDANGEKFAPKTLISQVQTSDGITLEEQLNESSTKVQIITWEEND